MVDKEKVIKGLECCADKTGKLCARGCPYDFRNNDSCMSDMATDALALLKEQEAATPKCKERMGGLVVGLCPTCGTALDNVHNVKACGKCGQAVKWE